MRVVAGRFRGRPLAAPGDTSVRPTSDRVRESVFNILIDPSFPWARRDINLVH
jgi:16S rRNA (guanine966-N2)-methyltransferase